VGTRIALVALAAIFAAGCNLDGTQAGGYGAGDDDEAADGTGDTTDDTADDSTDDGASDTSDDDASDEPTDDPSDPPADPPTLGASLFDTGLCVDRACTAVKPGIVEFKPRWPLWTDGAAKRRWIQLPVGTAIDDSNMDYWSFPVGTKLWKEFVRDGVRVETRYAVRTGTGEGDWAFMPYAWNSSQTDAFEAPYGIVNANGTQHDIPAQALCTGCHENVKSRVLGFSALQLDYVAPAGEMDLDDAIAAGWLSHVPGAATPHIAMPGHGTEQAALGYLHGNCGHCHNSDSPLVNRPMFRLEVDYLDAVENTRTYESTVNVVTEVEIDGATVIAKPGDPDHSVIITRMNTTNAAKMMPALGVELVDPTGQSVLRAWINALPQ
jgi:hypothetical protein